MDLDIKMEANKIKNEDGETNKMLNKIKAEEELIIEGEQHQWLPIKFEDEQNDYYQEYGQEFREDIYLPDSIKNVFSHEYYKIEYLDENDDKDEEDKEEEEDMDEQSENDKDDLYEPSEEDENDTDYEDEDDDNDNDDDEGEEKEEFYGGSDNEVSEGNISSSLKFWLLNSYVEYNCPECNKNLANYKELRKHLKLKHITAIEAAQKDYILSEKSGTCKKCQRAYKSGFNRYKHSLQHSENTQDLTEKKCKMCSYKTKRSIKRHFIEQHPNIVNEYKKYNKEKSTYKCPICHYTYKNSKHQKIWHHFIDKHPQEYQEKFRYNCHLCLHECFADEQLYLQHLMADHELNCWKNLNFRKLFDDKEYLACIKCHIVYLKNDTSKLLRHYLEHDNTICWSCRFCKKKSPYKDTGRSGHMCTKMISYYTKQHKVVEGEKKIKNLQEFEEYMAHVCPFCKEEFKKLLKWQQHLRSIHAIDTLKGLEMIAADNNKLHCNICHTMVANTPVQLHCHRFQHLPFKAYKCRQCKQSLATFKMAVNHVVKRCKDDKDRDYIKEVLKPNMIESAKVVIQCAFCNYQKFTDAKEAFEHYQYKHNNFEEFFTSDAMCIVCHKKFAQTEQQLRLEHVFTHFEEKIFKCPFCNTSHVKYNTCRFHKIQMHYYKPLDLKKEKTANHQSSAVQSQLAQPNLYSHVLNGFAEFISFACPACNEGLPNQKEWHTHITTQHDIFDESNVSYKDSDGSLKCLTCKSSLPNYLYRRLQHKLTHMPHRTFLCNLCYVRVSSLATLYRHFRQKHFAQGSFKCPICPEVLATSHQQKEHLKQMHPPHEWPVNIQCSLCYEILGNKSALSTHMVIHNNERINCDTCGSKSHSKKDEKSKFKEKPGDDIPSVSGCKVMVNIKEDATVLFNVDVKTKKANLNKRKSPRIKPDVMEVTELDKFDVKSKKAKSK
ncbi:zinc finger protein 423-like isoform X2 [Lucilia sericata]|uniref:zinc finger protein 423-like isoform X2 n=1 Tax=Lucilia sericata TaxID=13632 RepID=UPI0018A87B81|nr:zinc finger protein 423-like isoform X2 [Lucilia sericata]